MPKVEMCVQRGIAIVAGNVSVRPRRTLAIGWLRGCRWKLIDDL